MSLVWKIEFSDTAVKQMKKLDRQAARKIIRYLQKRISTDNGPKRFGKPLQDNLTGFWSYRVDSYRIICDIQEEKFIVLVLRVGYRSKIYGDH